MKKILKLLGVVLLIIVLVIAGFVIFVNVKGVPSYPVEEVKYTHTPTPEALTRGKKLASMLCAGCHLNTDTRKLTGKQMMDAPEEFGRVFSANITQDKNVGIGGWTDGDLVRLLRTGIKKNGQYAPPYMAKLPHMADDDINAIITFLRSDDPMVASDPTPDQPCEPTFLTKALCNTVFKPFPMPTSSIPMPDTSNTVELGRYLSYNLECYSCHSADFKSNDFQFPEKSAGYYGGGNQPLNMEGQVMVTQNLTSHTTGIGDWTKEQFVHTLRSGQKEGEEALRYPMLPYALLTEYEAGAIYDYLMTVPPIDNQVERSVLN